ncbi:UBP-type zinc finger domain-containing protein [Streptomyces sp. NPDC096934]|uniref:UBP-type zinc finger domain-containing protein n=1 Tax=Streptomyces sp. NPDC096934 TaxID=3155551 RepID=UPI003330F8AB
MRKCTHITSTEELELDRQSDDCLKCLATGANPIQLRLCLSCGHVGCCDSSKGKHATQHYLGSGHPVMRTIEPGEQWRWCFVDHTITS